MAIAPSPVTLQAVPKLSSATYRAIISAHAVGSNPKMLCNMPSAAIITPPGTPGAAMAVIPNMNINPENRYMSNGMPVMSIIAIAQLTIFNMLPGMCMVAHKGITMPANGALTPFLMVCCSVTGMVAALDAVPRAVMYAGNMFFSSTNGFLWHTAPAIENNNKRTTTWSISITAITFANMFITMVE